MTERLPNNIGQNEVVYGPVGLVEYEEDPQSHTTESTEYRFPDGQSVWASNLKYPGQENTRHEAEYPTKLSASEVLDAAIRYLRGRESDIGSEGNKGNYEDGLTIYADSADSNGQESFGVMDARRILEESPERVMNMKLVLPDPLSGRAVQVLWNRGRHMYEAGVDSTCGSENSISINVAADIPDRKLGPIYQNFFRATATPTIAAQSDQLF